MKKLKREKAYYFVDEAGVRVADFPRYYKIFEEGPRDLSSLQDDSLQFKGVPGITVKEDWFNVQTQGSTEYIGDNSASYGTANRFRAYLSLFNYAGLPEDVKINYALKGDKEVISFTYSQMKMNLRCPDCVLYDENKQNEFENALNY